MQVLATKLYIPPPRSKAVPRERLIARLSEGASQKLTLMAAPAGFGKSTLLSAWAVVGDRQVAWLSLDEGHSDPARFLTYLAAALQTLMPHIGKGVIAALMSPQLPLIEPLLTNLLNELAVITDPFVLILDDYHAVDSDAVDQALVFLLDHLPPAMHVIIATREDPRLPLARYRARGQLTELRAADLRFTPDEAAAFLNQSMGLRLSAESVAALETRTEGWIAGLQLAALSMQGQPDTQRFIQSFAGSHAFVLDYLIEEVLGQQPENVLTFLLKTSILDRMCGALCDAVMGDSSATGQDVLHALERANLFIVPLDNERKWYRYHHLFADLLRHQLRQRIDKQGDAALHVRASAWFESNGFQIEAFEHAVAADDIERAARLIGGNAIPLHFPGAVSLVLDWLASLPAATLDDHPALWVRSATLMLVIGQTTGVEEKLLAAETALKQVEPDDTLDLLGQVAAARATVALTQYRLDDVITHSRQALDLLLPQNLSFRAAANWTLGSAYAMQGDRAAAERTLTDSLAISRVTGDAFTTILAGSSLGQVLAAQNQLRQAAERFQHVLELAGEQPLQIVYEAHLGLARLHYEWNDLDAAERYGRQSLELARQYDSVIDRSVICEIFLALLKLARGDALGAETALNKADRFARQRDFIYRLPEVAAAQILALLHQGEITEAARLADQHDLPISKARALIAQGNASPALDLLASWRAKAESRGWQDERLKALVLQSVALDANGASADALRTLNDALAIAEKEGFIRTFVDEGAPIKRLLETAARESGYAARVLTAFDDPKTPAALDALSERELEVLRYIAEGLTNQQIADQLFLSLNTIKVHARNIFSKLDASNRTQAVANARESGILPP